MASYKLSEQEIELALSGLKNWQVQDNKLSKTFKFNTFAEAMGWMVTVGIEADKLNHHPEWCNVYNRVTVNLCTHDLGNAIGNLDVELATIMDKAAENY
ncbi:MAG: 4a-hydroxytetrahydrobiopterin dehydratase [Microcystaceae cyanobacterium]